MSMIPYLLALIAVLLFFAVGLLAKINKRLDTISGQLSFAGEVAPNLESKLLTEIERVQDELANISRNTEPERLRSLIARIPSAELNKIERELMEISRNTRRDTSIADEWRGSFSQGSNG